MNPKCVVECYNSDRMHTWFAQYYPKGIQILRIVQSIKARTMYFYMCMLSLQGGLCIDVGNTPPFRVPLHVYTIARQAPCDVVFQVQRHLQTNMFFSSGCSTFYTLLRTLLETSIMQAERIARFRPFQAPDAHQLISNVVSSHIRSHADDATIVPLDGHVDVLCTAQHTSQHTEMTNTLTILPTIDLSVLHSAS